MRSRALGQLVGLSTDAWKGAYVTADSDSDRHPKSRLCWEADLANCMAKIGNELQINDKHIT